MPRRRRRSNTKPRSPHRSVGEEVFQLYLFCRVMFGDVQQHLLIVGMNDWSDLDKPIQRVSGEEAWRAFRAKVDPMILERREDIYRYAPELTYKPK